MVDMYALLSLQGQLFLLMALGIFFRRRVVDGAFQKGLTNLLIDLVLPCNILASFQVELSRDILSQSAAILLISFGIQLGCWALALMLYRGCAQEKRPALQYGTICSNAGFLGMPVAEGLFGADGILLTSIFLIPQRIFMWTVGVSFYTRGNSESPWKKLIRNPCILAVIIGVLLMLTQIQLPTVLNNTIHSISKCCTGLSMLLIGMVISRFQWKNFLDPTILYYSVIRLLVIPGLTLLVCRLFHTEALAASVALVLVSMPAAGTTAVLASKYGADAEFAAGCVTISTVLSLVAIPLWCLAL